MYFSYNWPSICVVFVVKPLYVPCGKMSKPFYSNHCVALVSYHICSNHITSYPTNKTCMKRGNPGDMADWPSIHSLVTKLDIMAHPDGLVSRSIC